MLEILYYCNVPRSFALYAPSKRPRTDTGRLSNASVIMILVVWAITPLQNGSFSNDAVTISSAISVWVPNSLSEAFDITNRIGGNILS